MKLRHKAAAAAAAALLSCWLCGCRRQEPEASSSPAPQELSLPTERPSPGYREFPVYFDGLLMDQGCIRDGEMYLSPGEICSYLGIAWSWKGDESAFTISLDGTEFGGSREDGYLSGNGREKICGTYCEPNEDIKPCRVAFFIYKGAGTIEFLVDKHRNFYFLEMNTRLQVEHPITEEVLGVDLVKEQLRIANNEPLHLKQEELKQRGHAIECRICAEDSENNFMPSPGVIRQLIEPNGIGVRIDSYVYESYEIPIYYDPMIGKLIVWATTRQFAIERMRRVLYEYKITGLKTNIGYLRHIMNVPDFVEGRYDTLFIPKHQDMLRKWANKKEEETENIAMIAAYIDYLMNLEENKTASSDNRPISRWREFGLKKGVLRI